MTEPTEPSWFVLLHRPGPALGEGGSIFAHPDFGEHAAFLQRVTERGWLVAAGPLPDEDGAGMTVLRVPGPDAAAQVEAAATQEDLSVVRGLLTVTVRPWDVRMTAG